MTTDFFFQRIEHSLAIFWYFNLPQGTDRQSTNFEKQNVEFGMLVEPSISVVLVQASFLCTRPSVVLTT